MTTLTARKPATKTAVYAIARIQFKADSRKVVYLIRSSDGVTQYQTCLYNGYATSCDCPARKPCKHMQHAEACERLRGCRQYLATVRESISDEKRAETLSAARQESAALLESIDRDVCEQVAQERAQAATAPRQRSEQARIADDVEQAVVYGNTLVAEMALLQAGMAMQQVDPWEGVFTTTGTRGDARAFEWFYENFS